MLTHAIQKASDGRGALEPQGATDLRAFRQAIDAFPWAEQLAEWDATLSGAPPAVVLQNKGDQRELWVTALGTDLGGAFQVLSVSMRLRKRLFGKDRMEQDATAIRAEDREEVDRLCVLFCDGQYEALDRDVARLRVRGRSGIDD